jgi:hypothetical protein
MARAGKISSRRSIFMASSVLVVEGSLAAALALVEHPPPPRGRSSTMLHLRTFTATRAGLSRYRCGTFA